MLRMRIRAIAESKRRYGCPRIYVRLRREGWRVNHKRVERMYYRDEGLSLRRRRKKAAAVPRVALPKPSRPGRCYAIVMDICMPEMDGLELIPRIRGKHLGSKIIAMSGEAGYLDIAKYLGVDDTILKPFSLEDLLIAVSTQLKFADSRQSTP
jgi:CheY-like chemotaxis protein